MKDMPASFGQGDLQDQKTTGYQSPLGVTRTQTLTLRGVKIQSGFTFDQIQVSYQTLGKLSARRDNAILVCHALSGTAHVAGLNPETGRPGWWDYHVGPGKAMDTDKYFVICSNVLGGCDGTTGPLSTNPETGKPFGMDFPPVTVRDMVAVQAKLLEHLGIARLFAATGGSLGGMQALAWAADYPERIRVCVPIAACVSHNAMQIAFNEIGRRAITTDPNWNGGNYSPGRRPRHGLAVARMVGHVTYLSEYSMTRKFGRTLQPRANPAGEDDELFAVESYLHHQGDSFVSRFDPNSYLYLTKALDQFDLFDGKPPEEVLRRVKARFLVISFASDWLYPPAQSRELVRLLKRSRVAATYINLESLYGHDSFLIENREFANVLRHYLDNEYRDSHAHQAAAVI
ncbi:MAG TPA: homoserine O-acetyltransferase [Candidatus Acidoferrum sp.]|nr:homoserine O-acetyltransferase [Candidatus Acidoferrum sp.]